MHPHTPNEDLAQAERDAITIRNLNVLVTQLEATSKAQQRQIEDLEFYLGWEKRSLVEEVNRLTRIIREVHEMYGNPQQPPRRA